LAFYEIDEPMMLHNAVRLRNFRSDRAFQFNTKYLLPHLPLCFSRDFCCFCLSFTFRSHFSECHMLSLYLPFRVYFVFVLSPLRRILLGQVCCHITDFLQHAMCFLLFLNTLITRPTIVVNMPYIPHKISPFIVLIHMH